MGNNIIEIENLSFSYGSDDVLHDINVAIKEGKITTFLGANGCGKSTLFNILSKGLELKNGRVKVQGKTLQEYQRKEFAKTVSIVHQYNEAPLDITVKKLVGYGRYAHQAMFAKTANKDEEKIQWAMKQTHIEELQDSLFHTLSGGQKQRVWIAMALAQDTDILLLDEPTTYLDIRYQLEILELIQELNIKHKFSVIMILHDINQAIHYSDEIVAMSSDGHILCVGKPSEIITPSLMETMYGRALEVEKVKDKTIVLTM